MELRNNRFAARSGAALLLLISAAVAIAQNQASVISDLTIEGNKFVTKESILARMQTKVGQPYIQSQLDQDRSNLEKLGFFKAVDIKAVPQGDNTSWKVVVQLSEFEVVKEIRVVGNSVIPTEKIMAALTIQKDRPFNLNDQKPSADAVTKLYTEKGYFALVEQLEPLEDSPSTISVTVREMKVNSIAITGNTRTKDRVIKRLIKTQPGDAYNDPKWIHDLQRLMNTRWFDKVTPNEKQTEDGYGVDLMVDFKEARTGQVVFGATIDPRSSFAGQVKLIDTNFKGSGQTFGVGYQQAISGGGPSIDAEYTNPFMDRSGTSMSVTLYSRLQYRFTNNNFGNGSSVSDELFTERRTGGAISFSRPVSDQLSYNVGLKAEGIKTSNITTTNQNGFIKQDGNLVLLSLGVLQNRRDLDLDPSRGNWFNIQVEPGFSHISDIGGAIQDPAILGNHTFIRNTLEYRTYYSPQPARTGRDLDAPRRVFAFRARYGFITGTAPFNEQFFAGGAETVRGYADDRFWGKQTLLTSFEYRHPLQKAFNVILFADYGGAWGGYGGVNTFNQSDKLKLHLGYGIGFSFKTPLGPLRLDFGFNERGSSRTHFLIGTSF